MVVAFRPELDCQQILRPGDLLNLTIRIDNQSNGFAAPQSCYCGWRRLCWVALLINDDSAFAKGYWLDNCAQLAVCVG